MADHQNVGLLDSRVRVVLGIGCVALVGYHFLWARLLPLWALIVVIVLSPYFLKTGLTRVCPIVKAMDVSTNRESPPAPGA